LFYPAKLSEQLFIPLCALPEGYSHCTDYEERCLPESESVKTGM